MSQVTQNITSGYDLVDISDIVDKDLRNSASVEELSVLSNNVVAWRSQLLNLKRRAEMQFTSSSSRTFNLYVQFTKGELSREDYHDKLSKEKEWRCNTSRFLQQIEMKLREVKSLV